MYFCHFLASVDVKGYKRFLGSQVARATRQVWNRLRLKVCHLLLFVDVEGKERFLGYILVDTLRSWIPFFS